jgi:hypothetical protein
LVKRNRTCIMTFCILELVTGIETQSKKKSLSCVQWSGKRKWLWAIAAAPSSQHSMGHFRVVFVKTKIFYGPFNFCMGHLHRITKLYVSNGPWPLPFPITGVFNLSLCYWITQEIYMKENINTTHPVILFW